MNDDLDLLVSAYLDGAVDADERARVEADPELLAAVERMRLVRSMLGDTEPSSISTREALLANALDAWDRLTPMAATRHDATPRALQRGTDPATAAAAASITAPTSLADRRRATLNRRMLGAAAAIVVVLAGGIAAQVITGDRATDDSGSQTASLSATADDTADEALQDTAVAPESAESGGDEPDANLSAAVEESSEADGQIDTGIDVAAPPAEQVLEQLRTPEDLALFASDAIDAPRPPADVPVATSAPIDDRLTDTQASILAAELPLCLGADYVVGPALFGDVVVVVAVDEGRSLALAYLAESCREVARARLP
ncbi:MAG TPA: hypothetical protein VK853_07385 [Ilumatobacteraceae bacterium]|nr:hypothetical protein [Ilumatobacteraceae bacterium]